jgi:MATE family multidrug resistance protein
VPGAVRLTFFVAAIWQGLVGLAYVLVPGALLLAFAPPGAEGEALRSVGVRLLMLSAAWQLFDSAATTIAEALRAAGDTAYTMWARSVIAWLVFAPGSYVTVRHLGWGDAGAVGWLVLYLGLLSGVLFLRFRNGAWRRVQLTEPAVLA